MTHDRSAHRERSFKRGQFATPFAVVACRFTKRLTQTLLLLCAVVAARSMAGEVTVNILDRGGHGVAEVVVTLVPADGRRAGPRPIAGPTVMDQKHRAFVPRVLAVSVGTAVEFPNSDTVSHQVYSFSPAKRFQLPLYKGDLHPPVTFDREGLVVLGCNIHDEMAGYIYVTAAPYFGTTDAAGVLVLKDVAPGDYRLTAWSPMVADPPPSLSRTFHVGAQDIVVTQIQLLRDLRASPQPPPHRADWDY